MTSIIIVTYNSGKTISKLLTSIRRHLQKGTYEVIVVDNHSTDETVYEIKKHTWTTIITKEKNQGFSRACHSGVVISKGEYLLFINPDVLLEKNILNQLLPLFNDRTVGIVGCKILNPDGTIQPSVRAFPTLSSQIPILFKVHHLFPKIPSLKKYFTIGFNYEKQADVNQVMGALFLTTRTLWNIVSGFDKRFFIWFEEVDYCYQAKRLGYRTLYTPKSSVQHIGGHSFSKVHFLKKQWWFIRSMLKYFFKNGI